MPQTGDQISPADSMRISAETYVTEYYHPRAAFDISRPLNPLLECTGMEPQLAVEDEVVAGLQGKGDQQQSNMLDFDQLFQEGKNQRHVCPGVVHLVIRVVLLCISPSSQAIFVNEQIRNSANVA